MARKWIVTCAILAGCASSGDEVGAVGGGKPNFIAFSPMYSAFDDGVHAFSVTPSVPSAWDDSPDSDPLMAATVEWEVDAAYVERDDFSELPAAIKLTTKKAGKTVVKMRAKTLSGVSVRSDAPLTISRAAQFEWDAGEARFDPSVGIIESWARRGSDEDGVCGLPRDVEVPRTFSCVGCHNTLDSVFADRHTPTQTAGYSDEDLINVFTSAARSAGFKYSVPTIRDAPNPDCLYAVFHTWEMTVDEQRGIVWALRSIPPRGNAERDRERLQW